MAEQAKQVEEEENIDATETESDDKDTGSNQNQKQTFSQTDVNKIVAREKATWKRSADKEKSAWSETETSLREQLTARDEIIQKQVDLLKQDLELDEITVELLAEKDALEQFNTLVKIMEKKGKQNIPRTPNGEKKKPELRSSFSPSV